MENEEEYPAQGRCRARARPFRGKLWDLSDRSKVAIIPAASNLHPDHFGTQAGFEG